MFVNRVFVKKVNDFSSLEVGLRQGCGVKKRERGCPLMVKIIDLLGNDTTKMLKVTVN